MSCPSGQPDMQDARIFGVVGGSVAAPRVDYLKHDAEVTGDMLEQLGDMDPTHVFRFSAKCEEGRCAQFANGQCGLGARIKAGLEPVVNRLPSCQIRSACRWHREQGNAICYRCPQVVTLVPEDQNRLRDAAALSK
jgi:hypothetical protein